MCDVMASNKPHIVSSISIACIVGFMAAASPATRLCWHITAASG